jgi:hypothetical protein
MGYGFFYSANEPWRVFQQLRLVLTMPVLGNPEILEIFQSLPGA